MLSAAHRTQKRVNAALTMIDEAETPTKVRAAVAYAVGYIDALHDEKRVSIDGAQLYRADAFERRAARLAALREIDPSFEAEVAAFETELRDKRK